MTNKKERKRKIRKKNKCKNNIETIRRYGNTCNIRKNVNKEELTS